MDKRKNKNSYFRMTLSTKLFIISGVFIPLLNFFVMKIGVNFFSLILPFSVKTGTATTYGIENFIWLWQEITNPVSELVASFKNTFIWFFFGLLVTTPLTFIVSFFLYKKIIGYKFFQVIFFLPSIIMTVVFTACFKYMFYPDAPVALLLKAIFGRSIQVFGDSRYALFGMMFFVLWSGFGIGMILHTSSLNRIPQHLIEAGKLDGLGLFKEIIHIDIPLTWPFLSTMLMLQLCGVFSAGGPVLLFTQGAYGTFDLPYWLYYKTVTGEANIRLAATLGLCLSAIAIPFVMIFRKMAEKVEVYEF